MATNFKATRFLFLPFALLLITACNNPGNNAAKTSADQISAIVTSGTLNKLFADSAKFLRLDTSKKVVFVPNFTPSGVLVLHGWSTKQDTFNVSPDIILSSYDTSNVPFGNGMYLGNLILKKKELRNIQDSIRKYKTGYVIFIPKIINDSHFGYSVQITNDNPADESKKVTTTTQTGANMNPSPPKTY